MRIERTKCKGMLSFSLDFGNRISIISSENTTICLYPVVIMVKLFCLLRCFSSGSTCPWDWTETWLQALHYSYINLCKIWESWYHVWGKCFDCGFSWRNVIFIAYLWFSFKGLFSYLNPVYLSECWASKGQDMCCKCGCYVGCAIKQDLN